MKTHTRLILTLLLMLSYYTMQAQRLSVREARQRLHITKLNLAYESNNLYAFDSPAGFILTPANASQPALLGYSNGGSFAEAQKLPVFCALLEIMDRNLQKQVNSHSSFQSVRPAGVKEAVEPLLGTLYHQEEPFNNQCPLLDGKHCVSGCVANAMAEVMNYWNWPVKGYGTNTYTDSLGCRQTLTANFSDHTYDWDNILNNYDGEYTKKQADAVALLLSDCGIAVNTRYGISSSASSIVRQPIALTKYFDYDPSVQMVFRNFYRTAEWDSIMYTELSDGRPMIVGGWSATLAHTFTCDGYDSQGLFHVNLGNRYGEGDCYLNFDYLSPDMPEWFDKNNPERGMNVLQALHIGIRPSYLAESSDIDISDKAFYGFSHIGFIDGNQKQSSGQRNATYDIVVHNLANLDWKEHNGKVAIALMPYNSNSPTALLYTYNRHFEIEELTDTSYTDTLSISIPKSITEGKYRIIPVFDSESKWVEARTMVGTPNYLDCNITQENVFLSIPGSAQANLNVSNVSFPDSIVLYQPVEYSFDISNTGDEYSGRFYVCLVPHPNDIDITSDETQQAIIINQQGLFIESRMTVNRSFSRTPLKGVKAGKYHLRIINDIDLFTDSTVVIYEDKDHIITVLPKDYYTGIESINNYNNKMEIIYDLSGRMVSQESVNNHRIIIERKKGKRYIVSK